MRKVTAANKQIREHARNRGVCFWELADRFGVSAAWFSCLMRKEFEKEDRERALAYIEEIAATRQQKGA